MKKILAMLLATVMVVGCFTGCGSDKKNDSSEVVSTEQSGSKEETPELDMSETVKMGILVSDATSAEALAFRTYYTEYIQKQYNVELIYSDELKDAAGETSAIDTFITNNCKAIISFSSFDRAAQIEQCEAAGVYYAVATGTLTDEEYETYKGYEHYVGAIGPSLEVEYQTGYDMANYYLEQGKKNFAIFGGAIPYYTDMHIYRAAGMIAAMVDAGGADANYKGATDEAGIIGQIYADGQIIISNLSEQDFEELHASTSDSDGIIDQLRITKGVEAAIFLYPIENGYKVSMRSNEKVKVSEIAKTHGGGGHIRAAGCSMKGTLKDIQSTIISEITEQL